MNIKLHWSDSPHTHITGGEYAVSNLDIYIDPNLPTVTQRSLIIHAVIEDFCPNWFHEKVDELNDYIDEALEQFDKGDISNE